MSELGESVVMAINFLDEFFKDISRLVTTVEERITADKLVPLWGGTSFWYTSTAYYSSAKWMPKYIVRQYVEECTEDSKPDRNSLWFAFFNIYFTPIKIKEPVAIWGIGRQSEKTDLWEIFDKIALDKEGPDFLTDVPMKNWESVKDLPKPLVEFKYQSELVVNLCDSQTVENVIIQPLLKEIEIIRESIA